MNAIAISSPVVADERTITTQDVSALLSKAHKDVMSSANTLIRQRKNFSFCEYTFTHATNNTPVLAYQMPLGSAMMLIARLDIDYVPKFLESATRQAQPIDAIHHDLLFKINIPERWVVEVIKRRPGSVRATLRTARERTAGTTLDKHWECRADGYWYSAWFLANAPFTKLDGMLFKSALTAISETLGIETEMRQYLPTQPT